MLQTIKVRELHPLQQGLRPYKLDNYCMRCYYVRELHPLQQGLRPVVVVIYFSIQGQRATSITTRIKTIFLPLYFLAFGSQRATSITTRIKTRSSCAG